jgi:dihydrofolate synthase / folylpolyglutamate synthase
MTTPEDLEILKSVEAALMKRWPEAKIDPTLDRISALTDALGSPQLSYPTIHVGGTNGKTSTTRMVDSLMSKLDYRTGRFTSPHLDSVLERIAIKGEPISTSGFIATYNDIALYLDLIDSRQTFPLSYFEVLTAMAFVAFAEFPVDIGIIEVGMGGEWDSTNVLSPAVSVLTPIGMDHALYLGNSVEEIARTKAGIIKPESHVVLAAQEPAVAKILLERVAQKSAIPYREGIEFSVTKRDIAVGGQVISIQGIHGEYKEIFLPLYGSHQAANAAVALAAVEAFVGQKIADELVESAFAQVTSPGRFEILHRDPTVIVDVAHNPHGAKALAATISKEFDFQSLFGVIAVLSDKDAAGILSELEPVVSRIVVTENKSERALPKEELFEIAKTIFGAERAFLESDLQSAISYSMEQATLLNQVSDGSNAVLITGSVVTVGEAKRIIKKIGEK